MFQLVDAEKAHYPVTVLCEVLGVSRSGYYDWKTRPCCERSKADAQLAVQIAAAHTKSRKRYGSPRVHRALRRKGICVGKKRVERLMREKGIVARQKRRFRRTTDSNHADPIAPNIVQRDFEPSAPNEGWAGDVTYIATHEGWAYLATVIDLASRRVVGWTLDEHMRTELVEDALTMAFANRAPQRGLIFHSDRGCQYTSQDFAQLARANGVVLSVGRKGECWDNAVAESFFATIKRELIETRSWPTRTGLRRAVFEYIEGWYNTRRLHSTLGYLSPAQYEAVHHNANRQAA